MGKVKKKSVKDINWEKIEDEMEKELKFRIDLKRRQLRYTDDPFEMPTTRAEELLWKYCRNEKKIKQEFVREYDKSN